MGGQKQTNTGLAGVTAQGPYGWNEMGELGVVADPKKLSHGAFEIGEYGYGSMAEAFYSINPRRELIIIWITQQVDNHSWTEAQPKADLWAAAREVVSTLVPEKNTMKRPAAAMKRPAAE